jgi:hypothetical protein
MKELKKRLPVLALFLMVAFFASSLTTRNIRGGDVGATPMGGRYPYKVVVTLESTAVRQPFEFTMPLTRREYNDVRFSTKKFRKRAVKEARKALARKLGYDQATYGRNASELENARLVDVELVEIRKQNRRDGRISILRDDAVI